MKILVIQIGRYGDMILTTPLFQALRDHYVDMQMHVLASVRNHDILQGQSLVDHVHIYRKNVVDLVQSFHSLRSEHFDILIDPKDHYSQESSFISRVIHSDVSIGFNSESRKIFTHSVATTSQNDSLDPPMHAVDRNLSVLGFLGISPTVHRPHLDRLAEALQASFDAIGKVDSTVDLVVLNISAGQESRTWQVEKWIALASSLRSLHRRIVLLAAPDDHATAFHIAKTVGEQITVFASKNIHEAVALISRARLLITPDSAPVHIASAFDIPCVALFNSVRWNLHKFHPLSTRHFVVQPDDSGGEIADIEQQAVIDAAQSLLRR